jgi:hypothetical protein
VISWRYHLISIVAVFLAFGLGVLTGTTVLNDNLVRTRSPNEGPDCPGSYSASRGAHRARQMNARSGVPT